MKAYETFGIGTLTLASMLYGCSQPTSQVSSSQQESVKKNHPEQTINQKDPVKSTNVPSNKHPLEHIIKRFLEKEPPISEPLANPPSKAVEYATITGIATGKSYDVFEKGKPRAYFFILSTDDGIKTVETHFKEDVQESILYHFTRKGNEIRLHVDKTKVNNDYFFVPLENISLKYDKGETK